MASKVVSKKGAISVLIFGPDFHEFPGPGVPGAVQMASKAVFNTAAISMLISTLGGMKMRDEHGMLR